jgi:hypothetical protein
MTSYRYGSSPIVKPQSLGMEGVSRKPIPAKRHRRNQAGTGVVCNIRSIRRNGSAAPHSSWSPHVNAPR